MESGWMNGACCKRAATLDYSSDAKPAQPSEWTRLPLRSMNEIVRAIAFILASPGFATLGVQEGIGNLHFLAGIRQFSALPLQNDGLTRCLNVNYYRLKAGSLERD
jgi:hypothetical protein